VRIIEWNASFGESKDYAIKKRAAIDADDIAHGADHHTFTGGVMAGSNRKPQTSPAQEIPVPLVQRVAVYARVSTQRDQNPEMQLRELRQYAERRGRLVAGE
jgi:hypothetical protein